MALLNSLYVPFDLTVYPCKNGNNKRLARKTLVSDKAVAKFHYFGVNFCNNLELIMAMFVRDSKLLAT